MKEVIDMKPVLLFDLDGVILDSERPTYTLWKRELPHDKCDTLWEECLGLTTADEFSLFQQTLGWTYAEYQSFQQRTALSHLPDFQPGMLELFERLHQYNYTTAIVTSSSMTSVRHKLGIDTNQCKFNLHWVSNIISGDFMERGKPHPDGYIKAMDMLQVQPSQCIVIEDSPNGVKSAHSAGIANVIMVEDTVKCPLTTEFQNVVQTQHPIMWDVIQRFERTVNG